MVASKSISRHAKGIVSWIPKMLVAGLMLCYICDPSLEWWRKIKAQPYFFFVFVFATIAGAVLTHFLSTLNPFEDEEE